MGLRCMHVQIKVEKFKLCCFSLLNEESQNNFSVAGTFSP